jgi:hypothetical protein
VTSSSSRTSRCPAAGRRASTRPSPPRWIAWAGLRGSTSRTSASTARGKGPVPTTGRIAWTC